MVDDNPIPLHMWLGPRKAGVLACRRRRVHVAGLTFAALLTSVPVPSGSLRFKIPEQICGRWVSMHSTSFSLPDDDACASITSPVAVHHSLDLTHITWAVGRIPNTYLCDAVPIGFRGLFVLRCIWNTGAQKSAICANKSCCYCRSTPASISRMGRCVSR